MYRLFVYQWVPRRWGFVSQWHLKLEGLILIFLWHCGHERQCPCRCSLTRYPYPHCKYQVWFSKSEQKALANFLWWPVKGELHRDRRDGFMVKRGLLFTLAEGSRFSLHHSQWIALNFLYFQFPRFWYPLLGFPGTFSPELTCLYPHTDMHVKIH